MSFAFMSGRHLMIMGLKKNIGDEWGETKKKLFLIIIFYLFQKGSETLKLRNSEEMENGKKTEMFTRFVLLEIEKLRT